MKAKWENRIDWKSVELRQASIKRENKLKIELLDSVIVNIDRMANGQEGSMELLRITPMLLEEFRTLLLGKNGN